VTGDRRRDLTMTARRRVARLAVFAVLFQAMLFGWHHHSLPAMARSAHPIVSLHHDAGLPWSPATAEDSCEICIALHHLSASPLAFAVSPPPSIGAAATHLPDQASPDRAIDRAFHARAPPPRA
jgi:hypothetical protein